MIWQEHIQECPRIRRYYPCNVHKYGISEHKRCDNATINANSENARGRMEARSAAKREYRGKER
jgi:hypothetical protein